MPRQHTQPPEGTLGYFIRQLRTDLYMQRTGKKPLRQAELAETIGYASQRLIIDWEKIEKVEEESRRPTPDK